VEGKKKGGNSHASNFVIKKSFLWRGVDFVHEEAAGASVEGAIFLGLPLPSFRAAGGLRGEAAFLGEGFCLFAAAGALRGEAVDFLLVPVAGRLRVPDVTLLGPAMEPVDEVPEALREVLVDRLVGAFLVVVVAFFFLGTALLFLAVVLFLAPVFLATGAFLGEPTALEILLMAWSSFLPASASLNEARTFVKMLFSTPRASARRRSVRVRTVFGSL